MKFILFKKKKIVGTIVLSCVLAIMLAITYVSGSYVLVAGKATKKTPIYCVQTNEKKVAISFDASWGADKTDSILQMLTTYDVCANYFVVGFWVDKYASELKKLHDSNRVEIGTHSNTHPHMSSLSKSQKKLELTTSMEKIKSVIGKAPTLFRAPFGEYDDELLETASELGLYTIQWDVDTLDWKGLSATKIATRVLKKVKNGSIILMHNDGEHTVESLPLIIEGLKNKGYTFVTIGELIYKDNYEIDHTGKQIQKEG